MSLEDARQLTLAGADGGWLRGWELAGRTPEAPTLVLAHGWALTHASWLPVVERLRAEHDVRVVLYDQRGHGRSRDGRGRASIRALADDLAAVIDATAPTGDLHLAGHSMGGMTVLAYAGRHLDEARHRVRSITLVSTSSGRLIRTTDDAVSRFMQLLAHGPHVPAGRAISLARQRKFVFGEEPDDEHVRLTHAQVAATSLRTFGRYHGAIAAHDEAESVARLTGIPTTVLVGDRDRLTPVKHSRRIAEAAPHADLRVLPGRGHMLSYEATDEVTAAIGAHLTAS